ncbi:MAG: protease modulator HflC [Rhodospirillales bacterium]|nr:protease modulator HflC [Rhodospirillales bacterium]
MNRSILTAVAIGIVVLVLAAAGTFFTVDQTQQALVLQFGEVRRIIREPGLHLKRPLLENVIYIDKRVLDFEPPAEEVTASDAKRLVVDAFARFRIVDPLAFYQTLGSEQAARSRLGSTISGSLRRVLGGVTLASVLSDERDRIMRQITEEVAGQAKSFGIDVLDVRIRRADLPEENSQAIYARMQSEREREAREFRAQGAEFAQRIRSAAERERTIIIANGQRKAQILRGEGDAESVKIYAEAFSKDPEFFDFYRSLQAYRESLVGQNTTLLLAPTGEFFRFFGGHEGNAGDRAPAR